MKVGTNVLKVFIIAVIILATSCQKDDSNESTTEANICPEITMGNYEEAGIIINDFLNKHSGNSSDTNFEQLNKYLGRCDCVDSISTTKETIYTYPAIKEYNIRFVINSDTTYSVLDFAVFDDGRLEFRRFHQ
jgi:hypothetical protein